MLILAYIIFSSMIPFVNLFQIPSMLFSNIKTETNATVSDDSFVNKVPHLWSMPLNVHGVQVPKEKLNQTWITPSTNVA